MDPGTELLDLVSDFFREMAEAKPREVAEGYYVGVEHLIREMRLKEGKSRIEQEYFDTLAEFIEAPFKSRGFLPEKKGLPLATPPPSRTPKVSIDDLF